MCIIYDLAEGKWGISQHDSVAVQGQFDFDFFCTNMTHREEHTVGTTVGKLSNITDNMFRKIYFTFFCHYAFVKRKCFCKLS